MLGFTEKPLRLRRQRTEGWSKPLGSICCTRPGLLGNIFTKEDAERAGYADTQVGAVEMHRLWLDGVKYQDVEPERRLKVIERLSKIGGRHLLCFCHGSQPCHVDTLLERANPPKTLPT